FQTITPTAAMSASDNTAIPAAVGFLCSHFLAWATTPVCVARVGSCLNHRSRSLATARAEEQRDIGSFSRHFKQIVERSRSTFGFHSRGGRGWDSSNSLIVS